MAEKTFPELAGRKYRFLVFDPGTGIPISLRSGSQRRSLPDPLSDLTGKLVPGVDFPEDLWFRGMDAFYDVEVATRTLKKVSLPTVFTRAGLFHRQQDQGKMQEVTVKYAGLPEKPEPREDR